MKFQVLKRVMIGSTVYLEGETYEDANALRVLQKLRIPHEVLEDAAPELEDLKISELRGLADLRGLVHDGLKKAELIDLLRAEVTAILSDVPEEE
jgi:hypothetical protein